VTHPIHRRWHAEDLVRLRRADERRRYAASQRRGRIDPNPHQIHAVIFALARIREGGCILADEVGLGKTIEAGLIIVQLLAEGARRVLIVVPKPLVGQWQQELYSLFAIEVREGAPATAAELDGDGVFLVGREWAGGERGSGALKASEPFDLCVIDEAHEIFAGLYKRYDRHGIYQPGSPHAQMAGRVKELTGSASPIEFMDYEHAYGEGFEDMRRRVPDLRKIGEFVGYKPLTDLDGIIKSVIDFERK